jgi:hypothetical protein
MDNMLELGKEEQKNGTRASGVDSILHKTPNTAAFGF